MVNYRQGGKEIESAWFEYKEQGPKQFCEPKSLVDFVAGYSAAKNEKSKVYVLTEVTPNMGYEGYDQTKVIGVFSTFEALNQFMEANPTRSWAYHDYEEFEVQK